MGHVRGILVAMGVSYLTICITTRVDFLKKIAGL